MQEVYLYPAVTAIVVLAFVAARRSRHARVYRAMEKSMREDHCRRAKSSKNGDILFPQFGSGDE